MSHFVPSLLTLRELRRRSPARPALMAGIAMAVASAALHTVSTASLDVAFTLAIGWAVYATWACFSATWEDPLQRALDGLPFDPRALALDRAQAVAASNLAAATGAALGALAGLQHGADGLVWAPAYSIAAGLFLTLLLVAAPLQAAEAADQTRTHRGGSDAWLAAPGATFVFAALGLLLLQFGFGEPVRTGSSGIPPRSFFFGLGVPLVIALVVCAQTLPRAARRFYSLRGVWADAGASLVIRWARDEQDVPLVPAPLVHDDTVRHRALVTALVRSGDRAAPLLRVLPPLAVIVPLGAAWLERFERVPVAASVAGVLLAALGHVLQQGSALRPLRAETGLVRALASTLVAATREVCGHIDRRLIPVAAAAVLLLGLPGGAAPLAGVAALGLLASPLGPRRLEIVLAVTAAATFAAGVAADLRVALPVLAAIVLVSGAVRFALRRAPAPATA